MTRSMAWVHLKEKERKKEDQMSRHFEVKKQVERVEKNINHELEIINKTACGEMERQMKVIRTLESQCHKLTNNTAKEQAKANQDIKELQRQNRELRQELTKLRNEMQGLKTELHKRDRAQTEEDFGNYDPMELFENREIVFRTDSGRRQLDSPPRNPQYSPRHGQRSTRKEKKHGSITVSGQDTPPRQSFHSSSQQERSPGKTRVLRENAAITQWERQYQDQEARHQYGPMKSVSYAAATSASSRYSRHEEPRAKKALVVRR